MMTLTYARLTELAEEQITRHAAEAAKCEFADAVYQLRAYAFGAYLLWSRAAGELCVLDPAAHDQRAQDDARLDALVKSMSPVRERVA